MQHFKINNPDDEEPAPQSHWYSPGVSLKFYTIGNQVKSALRIEVQYVS